nr:MAG TPA: hypothetical protein [Caudoviricetes sp.]
MLTTGLPPPLRAEVSPVSQNVIRHFLRNTIVVLTPESFGSLLFTST